MGIFSLVCKGCGDELCRPEGVRVTRASDSAVLVGTYDGYGRIDGNDVCDFIDRDRDGVHARPIAWHEVCFNKASADERREDERREADALNAGYIAMASVEQQVELVAAARQAWVVHDDPQDDVDEHGPAIERLKRALDPFWDVEV